MGSENGSGCGLSRRSDRNPPPQQLCFLNNKFSGSRIYLSDGDLHYSKTISTMIPNALAELPALKEAQPPTTRPTGDQPTFLQRVLILLATICTMIVIDHGRVSSSLKGHDGFVSEYAFSTSSFTLLTKCFSDQTIVRIGVMTHIARSTCPATTSIPARPPIFGAAGDIVSYTNDLGALLAATAEIEPIQRLQSTNMVINPAVCPYTYVSSGDVCDGLDIPAQRD